MQTPVPWMAWHDAPVMQPPSPAFKNSRPGTQITAQSDGGGFGSETTHCAAAVAGAGTAGHGAEVEHDGAQYLPLMPLIWTAFSPALHGPLAGSPYGAPDGGPGDGGGGGGGPGDGGGGDGGAGPGEGGAGGAAFLQKQWKVNGVSPS